MSFRSSSENMILEWDNHHYCMPKKEVVENSILVGARTGLGQDQVEEPWEPRGPCLLQSLGPRGHGPRKIAKGLILFFVKPLEHYVS